jgi:methionyl-tRNA formyltransferase
MRVIYFGTRCTFSVAPLRILLEADCDVAAVIIPTDQSLSGYPIVPLSPTNQTPIPLIAAASEPSIIALAWERQLPIYQVSRLAAPETIEALTSLQPDVVCVACFPKRLPTALLHLPRWGCLNVHPSLLPQYRGPYPLFWMLRHGDRNFGVTVHDMDEHFDTGDIATQAEVELPDGVSSEEADTLLSEYGGECLVEVLSTIGTGTPARQPQPQGGSYFPAPQDQDFVIESTWSARRAFNFMRGTNEWSQLYPIELGEQRFYLKQALFYAADEILDQPYRLFGDQIDLQFSPGVLRALIA